MEKFLFQFKERTGKAINIVLLNHLVAVIEKEYGCKVIATDEANTSIGYREIKTKYSYSELKKVFDANDLKFYETPEKVLIPISRYDEKREKIMMSI